MRSTIFNAHEWFITVRFCVAVLLASRTLCAVLFDSRRFYFMILFCSAVVLNISLLFSAVLSLQRTSLAAP